MAKWSRREWLVRAGMGAALLGLSRGLLADEPHITVSPLNKLSDEDEIELGRRFSAAFEKEEPIVANMLIDRYLGGLVAKLAAKSQRPELPFSAKLINAHEPNAFSLPGGFLYISRGLVGLVGSEDELAAALSHEMGHVVARHVVNQLLLSFAARSVLKPVLDNLDKQNDAVEEIILRFGGAKEMLSMVHFSPRDEGKPTCWGSTRCCAGLESERILEAPCAS